MQWTSRFLEDVIVATCNEYFSLPKESKKKTNLACASALRYSSGLDSSIALFGAASCSQLDVSKSRGLLVQTQPLASPSVAALSSISFITGQQTIKQLRVLPASSQHGHLARQLALKTVKAMIRNDWTKCNDNIKQISGVCSSWLRGKDPSMTLAAFQSLWCHNNILASVTSPSGDVEGRLELQLHLSATRPVLLC